MFALELRMNPQQRQDVHRFIRHTGLHGRVIFEVATGAAKSRTEHHAQAPGPTFGDAKATLRRCDQGDTDQAVVDQQADGRQVLKKVLGHQLAHGGANPLFVAGALGFEQIAEGRLVSISLVQQRTRFAGVAAVEHVNIGDGGRGFGHDG
ncbi:hypothetical protein D3C75_940910 [compost metagenome]